VQKAYPHPSYWAAFVLTGDPGKDTGRGSVLRAGGLAALVMAALGLLLVWRSHARRL
jgi:hypothetical protein